MASDSKTGKYPVTYTFAGLVLLALAGLIVLRHLTGTISISKLGRRHSGYQLGAGPDRVLPGRFHLGHGQELHLIGEEQGHRLMNVNDFWDIVGGILVLAEVMAGFDRRQCLVSEDDILDGMVASLL